MFRFPVSGSLTIKVTKVGENTTFAKILKLVESSQQGKAPITRIADRFTVIYILLTLVFSAVIFFVAHNLSLLLSILLVTCADDLAVAIPLAFMAATTLAARKGIIIKGASYLEGFNKVGTMVFDKTGTITTGKPKIENIVCFNDFPERELLSILGAATAESNHPSSVAIFKFINNRAPQQRGEGGKENAVLFDCQKLKLAEIADLYEMPGEGIKGKIGNKDILVGRKKFLDENQIPFSDEENDLMEKEKMAGRSQVLAAVGGIPIGFVSLSDRIHTDAKDVISHLKNLGVKKLVMLTGDNERVASQVAKYVGIDEFQANLYPHR